MSWSAAPRWQEMGERVAMRQVLAGGGKFEATLPRHAFDPLNRRMEVPTRILDEDTYPVGGFTSLSNARQHRKPAATRNWRSWRRKANARTCSTSSFCATNCCTIRATRTSFCAAGGRSCSCLDDDLVATRYKENDLPYQQGVLLLALLVVVVRKLSEWLSTDALAFKIVFVGERKSRRWNAERDLLANAARRTRSPTARWNCCT